MLKKKGSPRNPNYGITMKYFMKKFGKMNPDDLHMLSLFKNLAANYHKDDIINAIDIVVK